MLVIGSFMNLSIFTLLISSSIGLLAAAIDYFHRGSLTIALLIFVTVALLCYAILLNLFERFIYKRIRNVYKLIRNLKLGKGLKDALGERITDEPIRDAEREVLGWGKQRVSGLDKLRAPARFRQDLLSNVCQVFNTPVFAIQGYVDTLQDGLIDDGPEMAKNF